MQFRIFKDTQKETHNKRIHTARFSRCANGTAPEETERDICFTGSTTPRLTASGLPRSAISLSIGSWPDTVLYLKDG